MKYAEKFPLFMLMDAFSLCKSSTQAMYFWYLHHIDPLKIDSISAL